MITVRLEIVERILFLLNTLRILDKPFAFSGKWNDKVWPAFLIE